MKKRTPRRQLVLRILSHNANKGFLELGPHKLTCAIGRRGLRASKREGDGVTPMGVFRLEHVFYRADRVGRPRAGLKVTQLRRSDGWCDAPGDRNYNRHVLHPYPASAERMWRSDNLYDVVVVLSHNRRPRVQGAGSAIFMHVARDGFRPTEGCVALKKSELLVLLSKAVSGTTIGLGR